MKQAGAAVFFVRVAVVVVVRGEFAMRRVAIQKCVTGVDEGFSCAGAQPKKQQEREKTHATRLAC